MCVCTPAPTATRNTVCLVGRGHGPDEAVLNIKKEEILERKSERKRNEGITLTLDTE